MMPTVPSSVTVMWLVMAVPFIKHVSGGPTDKTTSTSVTIIVPDQENPVQVSFPKSSGIPECLRQVPGIKEDETGITAEADVFTKCARSELTRLRNGLFQSAALTSSSEREDLTLASDAVDTGVYPQTLSFIQDMVSILNLTSDVNLLFSDLERIMRGDLLGVVKEYPDRINSLFQSLSDLPARIQSTFQQMDRMKEVAGNSNSTAFLDVLKNLQTYLDGAAQAMQDLPDLFSIVNIVDTLKALIATLNGDLESRIRDLSSEGADIASHPGDVLNELVRTIESLPETFSSILRSPDRAREFDVARLMDLPRRINSDISTSALSALDQASKSIQQLFTKKTAEPPVQNP